MSKLHKYKTNEWHYEIRGQMRLKIICEQSRLQEYITEKKESHMRKCDHTSEIAGIPKLFMTMEILSCTISLPSSVNSPK